MPTVAVRIPQMGEGLQEARLVEFIKQPGESVKRDEPIYVMETDKAVTEVESPYEGTLVEWSVEADSILPIGTEVGRMEVAEGVKETAVDHGPTGSPQPVAAGAAASSAPSSVARRSAVPIPPRTRKYLREKGLMDVADQIPAAGAKLMPEDVDNFLAEKAIGGTPTGGDASSAFEETQLPKTQQTLNFRMRQGMQQCIPAVVSLEFDWSAIHASRQGTRETTGESAFGMFCWCVVQAMKEHAAFRSALGSDGKTLRTYRHINLGIAVAVPGDLLKTAVVRAADTLDSPTFHEQLATQIEKVRGGEDQIDATTTVTISNIGSAGVQWGIPVIVTPAVATVALGEVRDRAVSGPNGVEFKKMATMTMTFDHRLMNGVAAANFMTDIRTRAEAFSV
ncbi:MAG: 2-oxo acid dehydrogenase subunit E2 [Planctomycetota bacterium]